MKKKLHFKECWTFIVIIAFLFSVCLTIAIGSNIILEHPEEYADMLNHVVYEYGAFQYTWWHLMLDMKSTAGWLAVFIFVYLVLRLCFNNII